MSHFSVMIKFQGDLDSAEDRIMMMLESYDENLEVDEYVAEDYHPDRIMKDLQSVVDQATGENCPDYLEHYKDDIQFFRKLLMDYKYDGWDAVIKKHMEKLREWVLSYYGLPMRDDGNVYSSYNPDSKWDWYELGGRWRGLLKLKEGRIGSKGRPSPWDNADSLPEDRVDIAKALDIDFEEDFHTFAVLDKDGWHEKGSMGWFGVTLNEEKDWEKKFKERFLSDLDEDTIIAIVDCHI